MGSDDFRHLLDAAAYIMFYYYINFSLFSFQKLHGGVNMRAIMLILINTLHILLLLVNISVGLNTTSATTTELVDVNQCSVDPRVSTFRCTNVQIDLIQEALNEWDFSQVLRIDISGE